MSATAQNSSPAAAAAKTINNAKKSAVAMPTATVMNRGRRGRPPVKKTPLVNSNRIAFRTENGTPIPNASKMILMEDDDDKLGEKEKTGIRRIEYPIEDLHPTTDNLLVGNEEIDSNANNTMDVDPAENGNNELATQRTFMPQANLSFHLGIPNQPLPFDFVDSLFDDSFTGHDIRHVHAPLTNHVSNHIVGHNRRPKYTEADNIHCINCEKLIIGEPDYIVTMFDFVAGVGHEEMGLCCSESCSKRLMFTENMQLRCLLFKTADIIYVKGKSADACGGIAPHRSRLRRYGGKLSDEEYHRVASTLVQRDGTLPLRQAESSGGTGVLNMRMYPAPLAMAIHSAQTENKNGVVQPHGQTKDELLGLWWDAEQHEWKSRDIYVDGADKRISLTSTSHVLSIFDGVQYT